MFICILFIYFNPYYIPIDIIAMILFDFIDVVVLENLNFKFYLSFKMNLMLINKCGLIYILFEVSKTNPDGIFGLIKLILHICIEFLILFQWINECTFI